MTKTARLLDRIALWIDPEPRDGAWNMAVDQALLETASHTILRVYAWSRPTVTIGYAQMLERVQGALPAWPVVRRWTGGGVVFHESDITYSLIVPASVEWSQTRPVESYALVHGSLADALVGAGFDGCRLATMEDVIDLPFCFEAPAVHDVVRGKVKIAGAGQRRSKIGLLHQGSVQQVNVAANFWQQWAEQLADVVDEMRAPSAGVLGRADELAETRYATASWLQHREEMRRVFVYGSLKRGLQNHHHLAGQRFIGEARSLDRFRLFDLGGYPGAVRDPDGCEIEGEVWDVDSDCLRALDKLEGISEGEYSRERVALNGAFRGQSIDVYVYLKLVAGMREVGERW